MTTPKCPICDKPLTDGFICLGELHDVAPWQLEVLKAVAESSADSLSVEVPRKHGHSFGVPRPDDDVG